jgi:hypothetical protein
VNSISPVAAPVPVVVYPNPAKGLLNLRFSQTGDVYDVVLVSSDGKTTEIIKNTSGDQTVRVTSLPPGIYQIQVKSKTGIYSTRVCLLP